MRLLTITVLALSVSLSGCGLNPPAGGTGKGMTANQVLRKTNKLAAAVNPQAQFYLLVGHEVDGDGLTDPDASGSYWVANYAFPDAQVKTQATILSYKVTPGKDPLVVRKDHSTFPAGYGFFPPTGTPKLDSSAMVVAARKAGHFVGQNVPLMKLYSPLQAQYYDKMLYYVGDVGAELVVLDANTGDVAQ